MAFVFFGKYDGEIVGFLLEKNNETYDMTPKFATNSHVGSVRCMTCGIAHNIPYCLTGGADEAIRIYNLKKGQEDGTMLYHKGDVTALAFAGEGHVLSGSADHSICMWKTKEWLKLHLLGGHKDTVLSISVHPSNRLALSSSADKTLRLWDLIKGRPSFIKKLPSECTKVRFSPDGDFYALLFNKMIQVYKVDDGELVLEVENKAGLEDFCYVENEQIAFTGNDKIIHLYSITDKKELSSYTCDTKYRVRTLVYCLLEDPVLIAGCSDGTIIVWDINNTETPVYKRQINGRITVCDAIPTFVNESHGEEGDENDDIEIEQDDNDSSISDDNDNNISDNNDSDDDDDSNDNDNDINDNNDDSDNMNDESEEEEEDAMEDSDDDNNSDDDE
ncbi:hypothetical protein WA158_004169 [Blastocystis sp. Blastoise]